MKCRRIKELLELLEPVWLEHQELNLVEMLAKLAIESGHGNTIENLSDDTLIYHLKMRGQSADAMIPGLEKDREIDFKAALLKARGIER